MGQMQGAIGCANERLTGITYSSITKEHNCHNCELCGSFDPGPPVARFSSATLYGFSSPDGHPKAEEKLSERRRSFKRSPKHMGRLRTSHPCVEANGDLGN